MCFIIRYFSKEMSTKWLKQIILLLRLFPMYQNYSMNASLALLTCIGYVLIGYVFCAMYTMLSMYQLIGNNQRNSDFPEISSIHIAWYIYWNKLTFSLRKHSRVDLVRISPQYTSLSLEVTREGGASDETSKTEVPGQSSCGTIKILPLRVSGRDGVCSQF